MASQTRQKTKKKVWFILAIIIVLLIFGVVIWQVKADKNKAETKDQNDSNLSPKAALTVTVIQPEVQNWKQTLSQLC